MLNLQHTAIKFTIEKEVISKSLTFFDAQFNWLTKVMMREFGESQPTLDYRQIIKLIVPKHGNLVLLCVFYIVLKTYALHVNYICKNWTNYVLFFK